MTGMRDAAINRLHQGVDPFAGFNPAGWEDPTDEWDSHHAWFDELLRPPFEPQDGMVIVEVGSFLGASSRHFARLLKERQINGVVICVDTWLAEQVLWDSPQWRPHLRIEHGRPQVYKTWMANALAAGLQDYLCPLSMDSGAGARYLRVHDVAADLIYLDASHEGGDVRRDMELYWPRLYPGGSMLVDDYNHMDYLGVATDVAEFARAHGLTVETNGIKALLRKAG